MNDNHESHNLYDVTAFVPVLPFLGLANGVDTYIKVMKILLRL